MASDRVAAKRAVLRSRIRATAMRAFADRGFDATTMADIADRLQMTGPAIYHYYETKDDLLFACVDQMFEQLHRELQRAAQRETSSRARLAAVVRAQVAREIRRHSASPLVNAHLYGPQYLTERLPPDRRDRLRQHQRELVQFYRGLIEAGAAAGELAPGDPATAALNVLAIVQYSGVWYRPQRGRRAESLVDAQVADVMRLLGADGRGPGRNGA